MTARACEKCGGALPDQATGRPRRLCVPCGGSPVRQTRDPDPTTRIAPGKPRGFEMLRDLFTELAPDGLTDECPARREKATA